MTKDELAARIEPLLTQFGLGSKLIFGDPVTQDDTTVISVAKVRMGFGYGFGKKNDPDSEGIGGGAGVTAIPIGYIEIKPDETRFVKIRHFSNSALVVSASVIGLVLLRLFKKKS